MRTAERRALRNRRALMAVLAGGAGMLLLGSLYLGLLGTPSQPVAAIGGPFRLEASDGRVIDEHSFDGRYRLLYFGYSQCRDVCPLTLAALSGALDLLGARAAVIQPIFVTVDPARDTPAALQRYLASFSPHLLGLSGAPERLRAMARLYHVDSVVHPRTAGLYDIDHNSVLYLMGRDGRFVAPIRADQDSAAMAADIAAHVKGS